ncbi:HpcH/HpaI aldolase/citrate lyase family protein [Oceanicola sp. 502str15]|uniref:HpcH/HpaI aldolase family protein n=1 Tax=Oceanicola sp. 502str15 TaxID=2696061 RepID=UPI00209442A6|nr:aldolase/citrate lyase family protein [Oceanicola sp. 502str15]MCO6384123.1 2,4-dihydroxyhept-2-ene-1,7-dioic acid aldolase [Oceanicola sp. 502str15]
MIKNKVKQLWAEGKPALHGWLSIGNPFTAEIMADQGYDVISVDWQHGALDYSNVLPMFQAMRASGVTLGARVPWLDPAAIMKALDAGAMQIICPMISTAEQAAEFVSYLRYPPDGQRSFGPTRAAYAQGGNIAAEANDEIIGWAMVETKEAMANLDAIAATPGLDGIYVGPADLTFSLCDGRYPPGFDREEPEMVDALKTIVETCNKHGIKAALHCGSAEYAARAIGWGYSMTTVSGDTRLLAGAAAASVKAFREAVSSTGPIGSDDQGGY